MSERIGWLIFTLISCALVSFIATLVGYLNIHNDANQMVDITKNWEVKAILYIQSFPKSCPYGYENAYNYVWPGTDTGCWCGDISYFMRNRYDVWKDLYTGYCDWNQTRAGCDEIRSTSSIPMNIWSMVNGSKATLCVQRSTETWMNVASYSGSTCPPGTIKCGLSVDNTFCTKGSKCPINDIQMSSLILPRDSDVLSRCNATNNCTVFAQDTFSAQIIKYQRGDTFDALPTAQFRLNEYGMCKDSTQDDVTPGRSVFKLLKRSKSDCKREGEIFWNKTAFQVSEKALFDWNGISPVIQNLLRYGYYDRGHSGYDYQYNLYSRSYIPWGINCRSQMSMLSQQSNTVDKLRNFELALMIMSCITGFILGVIMPIIVCVNNANNPNGAGCATTTAKWTHYLVRIGFVPVQFFALKLSQSQLGIYSSVVQKGCANSEVASVMSALEKDIRIAHYGNIACLVVFAVTTFVTFCFFLSDRMKQAGKYQLSDSLADPVSQPIQNDYYSQPRNDYEFQYQQNTQTSYQQPPPQNLLYAPPAPQEAQFNHAKPLYQPFDTQYYNTHS